MTYWLAKELMQEIMLGIQVSPFGNHFLLLGKGTDFKI